MTTLAAAPAAPAEAAKVIADAGARGVSCRRSSTCGHLHLDLHRLSSIRFYEPNDLTIGVDSGVTITQLDHVLAERGQWLPLDFPRSADKTVGAALAAHLSGPLRHGFGTFRDYVIGVELITAQGRVVHGGGQVVKNVAGYDLMKLAIGSRGNYAVISGANFKVFPRPSGWETAVFRCRSWDEAEENRSRLLHSYLHPHAVELNYSRAKGIEVYIRYAGSSKVRNRYRAELSKATQFLDGESETSLWERINDAPLPGDQKVALPPAQAIAGLRKLEAASIVGRLGVGVFYVRRGRGWIAPPADPMAIELSRRLKKEVDPENRLHGDRCGR